MTDTEIIVHKAIKKNALQYDVELKVGEIIAPLEDDTEKESYQAYFAKVNQLPFKKVKVDFSILYQERNKTLRVKDILLLQSNDLFNFLNYFLKQIKSLFIILGWTGNVKKINKQEIFNILELEELLGKSTQELTQMEYFRVYFYYLIISDNQLFILQNINELAPEWRKTLIETLRSYKPSFIILLDEYLSNLDSLADKLFYIHHSHSEQVILPLI